MRDGIYSFEVTTDGTVSKSIALVQGDEIKGLSQTYNVERSIRDRRGRWRVDVSPTKNSSGFHRSGFPAKLEGEENDDHFIFEGTCDADINTRVKIQGKWLCDLP